MIPKYDNEESVDDVPERALLDVANSFSSGNNSTFLMGFATGAYMLDKSVDRPVNPETETAMRLAIQEANTDKELEEVKAWVAWIFGEDETEDE